MNYANFFLLCVLCFDVLRLYYVDSSKKKRKLQTKVISPEPVKNSNSVSKGAKKQKLGHSGKKPESSSSSSSMAAPHSPGTFVCEILCGVNRFLKTGIDVCFFC